MTAFFSLLQSFFSFLGILGILAILLLLVWACKQLKLGKWLSFLTGSSVCVTHASIQGIHAMAKLTVYRGICADFCMRTLYVNKKTGKETLEIHYRDSVNTDDKTDEEKKERGKEIAAIAYQWERQCDMVVDLDEKHLQITATLLPYGGKKRAKSIEVSLVTPHVDDGSLNICAEDPTESWSALGSYNDKKRLVNRLREYIEEDYKAARDADKARCMEEAKRDAERMLRAMLAELVVDKDKDITFKWFESVENLTQKLLPPPEQAPILIVSQEKDKLQA